MSANKKRRCDVPRQESPSARRSTLVSDHKRAKAVRFERDGRAAPSRADPDAIGPPERYPATQFVNEEYLEDEQEGVICR